LATIPYRHALDDYPLHRALASAMVERIDQLGESAHRLERQAQLALPARRALIGVEGASRSIERGMLRRHNHRTRPSVAAGDLLNLAVRRRRSYNVVRQLICV
jgi:hypothetical protein